MLFHSTRRTESTMYKDVFRYRVAMPWREDEFTDAFDRLVARHPALRSSFDLTEYSVPMQVVGSQVPRAFDVVTGADDALVWDYMAARHSHRYDRRDALRSTACAHLSETKVWILFSRFITRFWTAGVSRT